MSDDKFRAWCFTINNWTSEDYESVMQLKSKYLVVGKEIGEQGTPHLQGYVYLSSPSTMSALSKKLKRAHLAVAKGDGHANFVYCSKGGDYYESGERPNQGARKDLDLVKDILRKTSRMADVVEVATSYQSVKMAEQILKYKETPRTWKPQVKWFYGPTGSGKSRQAYEELGDDCYTCLSTGRWFEGYDGHSNVLIDDMRKDFMKYHEFLRLIDRYEMRVECKGGTRQFKPHNIIITSCYHPAALYNTREDINQLLRRIDEIRCFGDDIDNMSNITNISDTVYDLDGI